MAKTTELDVLRANGFQVDRALKIVRHEVGHWLIGHYHGFKAGDISVTLANEGHNGQAIVDLESDLHTVELIESYARRRISVLYAGALAESLGANGKCNQHYAVRELKERGAVNDHKGIRELTRVLRGIKHGAPPEDLAKLTKQLQDITDEIWEETIGIVEEYHKVIFAITEAIVQRAQKLNEEFGMRAPIIRKLPEVKEWLATLAKGTDT